MAIDASPEIMKRPSSAPNRIAFHIELPVINTTPGNPSAPRNITHGRVFVIASMISGVTMRSCSTATALFGNGLSGAAYGLRCIARADRTRAAPIPFRSQPHDAEDVPDHRDRVRGHHHEE